MDAVDVDAGCKHIGVASERKSGQISTVRRAPDANSVRIDVRPRLQVSAGGEDVEVLGSAARPRVFGKLKALTVSDAEAVDGHRLDQGEHALAGLDSELAHRFARDARDELGARHVQTHVHARPAQSREAFLPTLEVTLKTIDFGFETRVEPEQAMIDPDLVVAGEQIRLD